MILKIIIALMFSTFLLLANPIFADSNPKINEFLAHPSSGNKEWVEFYNPNEVDLTTYFLDDDIDFTSDSGSSAKKSLSGIIKSDQTHPYLEFDSFLNNGGDYVVLFAPDGLIIDQYQYTKDPGTDISIGRSPDGNANFATLAQASKGSTNGEAKVDPTPDPTPTQAANTSQSTSQTTSATNTKTSSPTPAKSTLKSPSPQVSSSKASSMVLGQSSQTASISASIASPNPSSNPDQNVKDQKTSNTKVAYYMAGLGTILIASSFIFYFMTRRKTKIKEEDEQDIHN